MRNVLLAVDIREIASRVDELESSLSEERREKIHQFRFTDDRLRSLAAGLLIAEATTGHTVLYTELGKPYVEGGPDFNVSHSGAYAVMAIGDTPVGVDIERHREEEYAKLAAVAFHPDERRDLADNCCGRFFFDLWTVKESYMKMRGTGFALGSKHFRVVLKGRAARLADGEGWSCRFRLYDEIPGYSLAVCITGGEFPESVRWLRIRPEEGR